MRRSRIEEPFLLCSEALQLLGKLSMRAGHYGHKEFAKIITIWDLYLLNVPMSITSPLNTQEVPMPERSSSKKNKIERVMHEHKRGTLKSSSGDKVKSRKQALAIALSEAGASKRTAPKNRRSTSKGRK